MHTFECDAEQVLQMYEQYQNLGIPTNRTKRNKVMLGLMVYQGLTVSELQKLEISASEAVIYVPQVGKTNPGPWN